MSASEPAAPVFAERPTERVVPDAWRFAAVPAGLGVGALLLGGGWLALLLLGLAAFVVAFFRNPERPLPPDPLAVVAPADGRVIAVDEVEEADGRKGVRIGIFLSVFNVHVNRAPLAGRVRSIARGGTKFLAAFDPRGETENVRLAMDLELADGRAVRVTQITGLVARRIVCHPQVGEWLGRGVRYGLIRFGSRTDVLLPPGSEVRVQKGDRVKGGRDVIARLEEPA